MGRRRPTCRCRRRRGCCRTPRVGAPAAVGALRYLRRRVARANESCAAACAARGLWCGPDFVAGGRDATDFDLPLSLSAPTNPGLALIATVDNCPAMVEAFGARCVGGCVAVEAAASTPADHKLPGLFTNPATGATSASSHRDGAGEDDDEEEEDDEDDEEEEEEEEGRMTRRRRRRRRERREGHGRTGNRPSRPAQVAHGGLCPCVVAARDGVGIPIATGKLQREPKTGLWEREGVTTYEQRAGPGQARVAVGAAHHLDRTRRVAAALRRYLER